MHAIYQQGSIEADELYTHLDSKIGTSESTHPDFYVYMESWRSSDDSPYNSKELISFLNRGVLIQKLNDFQIQDDFRSPNIRGLVRILGEAIKVAPMKFILHTKEFLQADSPYQYGFINGYFDLWKTEKSAEIDTATWVEIWVNLFDFFEKLLLDQSFWLVVEKDDGALVPKKPWIPPLIADFIRSGLQINKAFSQNLLPRAFTIINELLKHLPSESKWDSESAMTQAINSSKGKAIEVLVHYALCKSRLSEKNEGNHSSAWEEVKPIFDAEIIKSCDDNFEFSTLMGSYIENINYLNNKWLEENLSLLFPEKYPKSLSCIIQGLAYSHGVTEVVYRLLRDHDVFKLAINSNIEKREIKYHLMQRIALAYLWGEESLETNLFKYLYNEEKIIELGMIARFFWSIQNQKLEKSYEDKIIAFWRKCIEWCKNLDEKPAELMQNLILLSCYINKLDKEKKEWVLMSVPFINSDRGDRELLQQLNRLVDNYSVEVLEILEKLLKSSIPTYDIGGYLKSLVIKLADNENLNFRKRTLLVLDKLKNLPGFQGLYEDLNQSN